LWKQIFAGVAIGAGTWGHIPRVALAPNAESTKALQLSTFAAGASLTIFRDLLAAADGRLRSAPNKVILVSDTIFANWQEYKESKVLESSWKQQDFDMQTGVYRGCTIIPMDSWDRHIIGDFDNGTTWHLPHRAVLTTVEQLAVGFDSSSEMQNFDAFLDKTTELYNIKAGYKLDTKTMEHYMIAAAY